MDETAAVLTAEQIDAMPAGREMDALVAEKVMGLTPELSWQVMNGDESASCFGGSQHECAEWLEDHRRRFPDSWVDASYHVGAWKRWRPYSEQIVSAWQVVEKMRELKWMLALHDIHGAWTAEFSEHDGDWMTGRRSRGTAETTPLAICRAALKRFLCGGSVEEESSSG